MYGAINSIDIKPQSSPKGEPILPLVGRWWLPSSFTQAQKKKKKRTVSVVPDLAGASLAVRHVGSGAGHRRADSKRVGVVACYEGNEETDQGFFDDKEGDVTHPCVPRRPNQPQSTAAPAHPRVPKEACCASLMSGVNRGFGRGGKTGKGRG